MLNLKRELFKVFKRYNGSQRGISILLGILITSIILAISLGINLIVLKQTKMMRDVGYSVVAFYAADNGIENGLYALYVNKASSFSEQGYLDANGNGNQDPEEPSYSVNTISPGPNCSAVHTCLKSIGIYKGTRRAIEIQY